VTVEPLERLEFDTARLLAEHPPRWRDRNKEAVFRAATSPACPPGSTVVYARWSAVEVPPSMSARSRIEVRPGFFDYAPSAAGGTVDWHVNFADPELFVAYGGCLMAQDELQVAEHPVLASLREALVSAGRKAATRGDAGEPTPVTVTGAQRRCSINPFADAAAGHPRELYGNAFAAAPVTEVLAATRSLSPPPLSNILAMAAPAGGRGPYERHELQDVLDTAYTGFAAARQESLRLAGPGAETIVHTGFWGCGAFGGDRTVMTALQALAADLARVDLVFHAGRGNGPADAEEALRVHAALVDAAAGVDAFLGGLLRRGPRWGVSNGT
jgi:hypothetical protein